MALRRGICVGFASGPSQDQIFPTRVCPFGQQQESHAQEFLIQANSGDKLVLHLELQNFNWMGADTLMVVLTESALEYPLTIILDKDTALKGHRVVQSFRCYDDSAGTCAQVELRFASAEPSQNDASMPFRPEHWKSSAYFKVVVYRLLKASDLDSHRGRTVSQLLNGVHFGMSSGFPKPPKRASDKITDLKLRRSEKYEAPLSRPLRYCRLETPGNRNVQFVFHYRTTNWVREYELKDVEELQTGILSKRGRGLFANSSNQTRSAAKDDDGEVVFLNSGPSSKRARVESVESDDGYFDPTHTTLPILYNEDGSRRIGALESGMYAKAYGVHEFRGPMEDWPPRAINVETEPSVSVKPGGATQDVSVVEQNVQQLRGQSVPGRSVTFVESGGVSTSQRPVNNVQIIEESPPPSFETMLAEAASVQDQSNPFCIPSSEADGGDKVNEAGTVSKSYQEMTIPSSQIDEHDDADNDIAMPSVEDEEEADDSNSTESKTIIAPSERAEEKKLVTAQQNFTRRALDISTRLNDVRSFSEIFHAVQPIAVAESGTGTPAAEHARIRENNARRAEYGAQLANVEVELDNFLLDLTQNLISTTQEDMNGLRIPRSAD